MCACVAQDYTYSKQPSHGRLPKIVYVFLVIHTYTLSDIVVIVRRKIIYIYDCRKIVYTYQGQCGPFGLCILQYLDPPAHGHVQPHWNIKLQY